MDNWLDIAADINSVSLDQLPLSAFFLPGVCHRIALVSLRRGGRQISLREGFLQQQYVACRS